MTHKKSSIKYPQVTTRPPFNPFADPIKPPDEATTVTGTENVDVDITTESTTQENGQALQTPMTGNEVDNEIDLTPFVTTESSLDSYSTTRAPSLPMTMNVEAEMNVKLTTKSLLKKFSSTPSPQVSWTESVVTSTPFDSLTDIPSTLTEETDDEMNEIKKNTFTVTTSESTTPSSSLLDTVHATTSSILVPEQETTTIMTTKGDAIFQTNDSSSITTTTLSSSFPSPSQPPFTTTPSFGLFDTSLTPVIKSPILPILTNESTLLSSSTTSSGEVATTTDRPYASHLGEYFFHKEGRRYLFLAIKFFGQNTLINSLFCTTVYLLNDTPLI